MFNEKKSVINARDINGVVAKLNHSLNRSAGKPSAKRTRGIKSNNDGLKSVPTLQRPSVRSLQAQINGQGLYTLRLKVTDKSGSSLLGILSAFARSRKQAVEFIEARMEEMRLSTRDFALLRYTPSECSETMEKIVGIRQFFRSARCIRAYDGLQDEA